MILFGSTLLQVPPLVICATLARTQQVWEEWCEPETSVVSKRKFTLCKLNYCLFGPKCMRLKFWIVYNRENVDWLIFWTVIVPTSSLAALYLFQPTAFLSDSSNHSLNLLASPYPPSYDSNCQWAGASCAYFSSPQISSGTGNYFIVPNLNLSFVSQSQGLSICTWFVYDQVDSWARIFDFGDGQQLNNILLAREGTSSTLILNFLQGSATSTSIISPLPIALGVWRHFCIVNQGYSWVMYDNGAQTASYWASWSTTILPTVLTSNYIGRSNWNGDAMLRGRVADFRIYSQALSPQQVFAIFYRQGNLVLRCAVNGLKLKNMKFSINELHFRWICIWNDRELWHDCLVQACCTRFEELVLLPLEPNKMM